MAAARGRRRISLNGLGIGVSAFALSFMLVALLVVGSSRAAFVEQADTVLERVTQQQEAAPPAPGEGDLPRRPVSPSTPDPDPGTPPVPEALPDPVAADPPPAREIALTDDSSGTAMFTGDVELAPGTPEQRCITVTFDGAVDPRPVVLRAASAEGPLAPYLDLVIELGGAEGAVFGDCSGFEPLGTLFTGTLATFGADHAEYATGLAAWEPVATRESRSFRFTVSVRDDPAAEGLSAGFGFTWEARD